MKVRIDRQERRGIAPVSLVIVALLLSVAASVKAMCAESLRLGFPRDISAAPIYVAESQGFFRKWGVTVVMNEYEAGAVAVNDLVANKLDLATASEFVFVLQSSRHTDLRMPATVCTLSVLELVVRKDSGIARPQDLKGKRVAVVRGTASEFFLFNYFAFNRIPRESVEVVYHPPSEIVKAVVNGMVDAAISWPPYTAEMAKQLGVKAANWPAQSGQDYYYALIAKETFLKRQPKMMERFLGALSDAEEYIVKYPDRVQTLLLDRLKVDRETLLSTWSRARFRVELTQDLLVLMEREAKWAIRNKLVEKRETPNYLEFLYFDALDKVKPEVVSVVH
jgi:ABC-type nitrate/sulfonate/bicarbonate transport system substrate-binding protein